MIAPGTSLIDGAFAVCTAFDAAGFVAVLCGGSAATYYAPDAYMSTDDDFVLTVDLARHEISAIMQPLGFREQGRIYVGDGLQWSVDFPPGPLAIGRDIVRDWDTVRRGSDLLHVITALDSVRDRFMHYFAWNDYSGLSTRSSLRSRTDYSATTGLMSPKRPARKSSNARWISSTVFITNGP